MQPLQRTTHERPPSTPRITRADTPRDHRTWFGRIARFFSPNTAAGRTGDRSGNPLLEFPAEAGAAPEPAADMTRELAGQSVPRAGRPRARVMAIAAGIALVVAVAGLRVREWPLAGATAQARQDARLTVESQPASLEVLIDGVRRGTTPLNLAVAPGAHSLTIRNGSDERVVSMTVAPGADVVRYFEMRTAEPLAVSGRLSVVTDPPGARVFVDGRPHGLSPVTVADLAAAQHRVTVATDNGSLERMVSVAAGSTASVMFSLPKVSGPVGGWLAVTAPFEVDIVEGEDVIGRAGATRIMLTTGRHSIVLTNRDLGYEEARTVEIAPGKTTAIQVNPPNAQVSVNARPWAEIVLDGASVGQTPIANMLVPIGSHEVIFRHPGLAEVRQTVIVTANGPNRIAVDLTK
jgi:eukaryotic-like serine/threonine-protein kinase